MDWKLFCKLSWQKWHQQKQVSHCIWLSLHPVFSKYVFPERGETLWHKKYFVSNLVYWVCGFSELLPWEQPLNQQAHPAKWRESTGILRNFKISRTLLVGRGIIYKFSKYLCHDKMWLQCPLVFSIPKVGNRTMSQL